MNRRGFFRFLGQATVVAAGAPAVIASLPLLPRRVPLVHPLRFGHLLAPKFREIMAARESGLRALFSNSGSQTWP